MYKIETKHADMQLWCPLKPKTNHLIKKKFLCSRKTL